MRNWTPEIVGAFERYNNLVREADYDRRVHPVRIEERRPTLRHAAKQAVCRIEPVRTTRLCLTPSVA
jgi:hypothetical protein